MVLMAYSGARGTLIYEKNLMSKFSCQTPFKAGFNSPYRTSEFGSRVTNPQNRKENLLHCSTCHIQIVGKAEEDGPGIAGQIVVDPGQHGRHIYGLRAALDTDHPGPTFRSWDLQEETFWPEKYLM
jgi:hypothetical protein